MQTRTVYTKQLENLDSLLSDLASKTALDIRKTARGLAGDKACAQEVCEDGAVVSRMRSDIEGLCLDIMLMQQPLIGADLRFVSGSFRVVSDLCHIAEKAASIAKLAQRIPAETYLSLIVQFDEASARVADMVDAAYLSFKQSDEAAAETVFLMDDAVDELYRQVSQAVVDLIRNGDTDAEYLPEVLMIAKYYERMGDDAQRVAAWTVFRVTGEHRVAGGHRVNSVGE